MHLKTLITVSILTTAAFLCVGQPAEAARAVVVGTPGLRTGPDADYRIIGRLRDGERVDVTSCTRSGRWCHVQPRWLRDGWVVSRALDRVKGTKPARRGNGICFFSNHGEICLSR